MSFAGETKSFVLKRDKRANYKNQARQAPLVFLPIQGNRYASLVAKVLRGWTPIVSKQHVTALFLLLNFAKFKNNFPKVHKF